MSGKYPWSNLDDDQIEPGLDPRKFPRTDYITQRTWNDYWDNNPHGGLITFPPPTPSATPWTGFIDTNSIDGILSASGLKLSDLTGGGGGGGTKPTPQVSKIDVEEIKLPKDKSEEELARLFLMDIGGRELVNLTRHDQINGINQEYSPIKNLADISLQYNPFEISPNADNVTTYLTTFNFDITKYIPTQAELDEEYPLEADAAKRTVVYFDKSTNSLNVHVKNIFTNERVEVEFIIPEEVKDGTIYT